MKRLKLDREQRPVKEFFRTLLVGPDGLLLELDGRPMLRLLPGISRSVDRAALKAAILRRRDASRRLNAEWEVADQETWDRKGRVLR